MLPDRLQRSCSVLQELLHHLSLKAEQQPVMGIVYSTFQRFLAPAEVAAARKAHDAARSRRRPYRPGE
jgi:hypothetical protein